MEFRQAETALASAFAPVTIVLDRPEEVLAMRTAVYAGMRQLPNAGAVPNMGAEKGDAWFLDVLFGRLCDARMPPQYATAKGSSDQAF